MKGTGVARIAACAVVFLFGLPLPAEAADRGNTDESIDLRVSKGMHSRGYGAVRISVVDDNSVQYNGFFDYEAPFVHRWTNLHLHTTIKDVLNGSATFDIGGQSVAVKLPTVGHGARGLLLADPCISSRDFGCPFLQKFKVFDRLVGIINTLVGSDEIDFWGILGDNFYESRDPLGQLLFRKLSVKAKATPFLSVPGNHDFWITGGPRGQLHDQFGNGFMQYYGQDTEAAIRSGSSRPFDFSANPDAYQIATLANFVFSHQIGNIAFFGYSGAHPWSQLRPFAEEFCHWVNASETATIVMVLGHWNADNLGCVDTSAPNVWMYIKHLPGCTSKLVLYVDGHEHCNAVTEPGVGFMIGANGQGGNCEPQFGFMVIDTNSKTPEGHADARVDYFEVARGTVDNWATLHDCLKQSGYIGCRDSNAIPWRRSAAPPTTTTLSPPPGDGHIYLMWGIICCAGAIVLLGIVAAAVKLCGARRRRELQQAGGVLLQPA